MGRRQPAPALHQSSHERVRDAEWRVGDDVEVAAGQTKVGGVCLHNGHARPEPRPQLRGTTGMKLDGDDPRSRLHQRFGERSPPGADVDDEVAGTHA